MPPGPEVPASALEKLARTYEALDRTLVALGPRCETSGACCNFLHGQYVLYASALEFERVRIETGESGPWPLRPNGECPFLKDRKCSIHSARPLGCRTYFCDPDYRPHEMEVYQRFCDQIAEIHTCIGIERNYGPFHGPSGHAILRKATVPAGTPPASSLPVVRRPGQ